MKRKAIILLVGPVMLVMLVGSKTAAQTLPQRLPLTPSLDFRLRTPSHEFRQVPIGDMAPAANSEYLLRDYFKRIGADTPRRTYLADYPQGIYGMRRTELSRMGTAMRGAEMAASVALFMGAIGNTTGWFSEDVTWMMMGASALGGALWGGTAGYENPNFRIRYTFEP